MKRSDIYKKLPALFVPYFTLVLGPKIQSQERNSRECRTLCEIMDSLCEGNLARVGDVAMQRYKALACATDDGSWALASEIEVIDPGANGEGEEEKKG